MHKYVYNDYNKNVKVFLALSIDKCQKIYIMLYGVINMYNQNEEENVLEKYGRNINEDVKKRKIDPVIGRDEEIRSITRILSRKTKKRHNTP